MAVHSSLILLAALMASTILATPVAHGSSLAGAYLRGLTAPQQAVLAEHLATSASGGAAQLPHGRQLMQGKGKTAAGKQPAPAPAPEPQPEIAIIIDLPPGVEREDLTPAEERQLIGTALGIAAAVDNIDFLFAPAPAPAVEPQPV